jgi:uncharacterized protein YdaU (DUF1376 family)
MPDAPYMKLYVSDYLGDTTALTTEQHGAYLLLLMALWNAGGTLPLNHEKLARICRLTPKKWKAISDDVLAFFDLGEDDFSHNRVTEELQKVGTLSKKRSAAGAKGGRPKTSENSQTTKANAKANAKANEKQNGVYTRANHSHSHIEKPQDSSSLSAKRNLPPDDDLDIPASLDRRAKTGRRLSEDWKPEQLTSRFASLAKCTISEINRVAPLEFEKFRNYWLSKTGKDATKLDWQKTWENWLLKALQDHYRGRHAVPRNQREPDPLQEAVRRRMEGGNG